jgi:ribosome-associated toxin RatA of RatAB toxin-antitoxin module
MNWAEHSVEIDGSAEECFDAIVDYESFPKWQKAVEKVEVLERDRDNLGKAVHLYVIAKGRRVDYTLEYHYDRPARIWWDFAGGNGVRDVDGEYTFSDAGGGRTRATYKLGVDPGLPIPGAIAKRIHKQALTRSVEDLKEEVERRGRGTGRLPHERAAYASDEGSGGGYGPLGILEVPLGVARGAAERAVGTAGSVAGSVAGHVGGLLDRVRGGGHDED